MSDLHAFGDNIWVADGPPVSAFGPITLPTRMVVVRFDDGSLWINSPVEPSSDLVKTIKQLGTVRYLVSPTPMHVWRLDAWNALFPLAQLWGPPNAQGSSAKRTYAGVLADVAPMAWSSDIDQVVFRGNLFFDEVEFFHKPSQTLMITDFVQNYPAANGDPVGNLTKMMGGVLNGGVPRDIRCSFTRRSLARASLTRMLTWDFDRVVVAHGANVENDARAFVEGAFQWLVRSRPKRR